MSTSVEFTLWKGVHNDLRDSIASQAEHEELHAQLRSATQAGGDVGDAAKALAKLMHPHFVKEDEFALPPLALLHSLAHGAFTAEMADVLELTDRLAAELPTMLAEHEAIVASLERLAVAAKRAERADIVAFARMRTLHAQTEEQVMYPAALLVGRFVRQRLAEAATARRSSAHHEIPPGTTHV